MKNSRMLFIITITCLTLFGCDVCSDTKEGQVSIANCYFSHNKTSGIYLAPILTPVKTFMSGNTFEDCTLGNISQLTE